MRAFAEDDVWKNARICADAGAGEDVVAAHEHGARADGDALADDAVRADVRAGIDLRGVGDACACINARHEVLRGMEKREHFCKCDARIRDADDGLARGCEWRGRKDGRGVALLGGEELRLLFREGEVARARGGGGGEAGDEDGGITEDFALDDGCDFGGGVGHGGVWVVAENGRS